MQSLHVHDRAGLGFAAFDRLLVRVKVWILDAFTFTLLELHENRRSEHSHLQGWKGLYRARGGLFLHQLSVFVIEDVELVGFSGDIVSIEPLVELSELFNLVLAKQLDFVLDHQVYYDFEPARVRHYLLRLCILKMEHFTMQLHVF